MSSNWRLIYNPEADAADILAYPSAVLEGKLAGKFLSSKRPPNTLLIQGVKKPGVIVGADVFVRQDKAAELNIDVAKKPRSGRGGLTPLGAVNVQKFIGSEKDVAPLVPRDEKELALLIYTSGTTGRPKGAMLSNGGLYYQSRSTQAVNSITDKDNVLIVLPLYHGYGLNILATTSVLAGSTLVLVPQYDPVKLIETMRESKTTIFSAVPTILIHLLLIYGEKGMELPKTIRITYTGGAPTPGDVLRSFEKIFSTEVYEGLGITECTGLVSVNPEGAKKLKSIGKPMGEIVPDFADLQMKIVDEKGNELPPGEMGEILVKTEMWGMLGYYNRPLDTAEAIRDGWFYTGDMGWKDEDGYYFITDRKKDMIITGGFNVYPRELEEIINEHPKVLEAAVIGVPHETHGEVAKAVVVLNSGQQISEDELTDYCKANMAEYKVPRFIEFRESLPKVLSGKVLKKELRDDYTDDRELHEDREGGC